MAKDPIGSGENARVSLSPTLRAFMVGWQPRQRRTAGMLHELLGRLQAVANAHPDWKGYDLLTHLLAALHLIIENDRLTGGHTEEQIVDELSLLVAADHPEDGGDVHRSIAEAVVDVLTNARERRLRLRDTYTCLADDSIERREQSFAFVRTVGDEESAQPTLRATPEAINVFQNLFDFDPSDRAAAERYRSERMLKRADYDEVLTSVERRATSVHGLRGELEGLARRLSYNVRDVDYAGEVIPRLDEVLATVTEQVTAEERFADVVASLSHHAAPDLARLQRISSNLGHLIGSLADLQSTALRTRRTFEAEQDRQLFTYRRVTINPRAQILDPLLRHIPDIVLAVLEDPLIVCLGPRVPRVVNLGQLVAKCIPGDRPAAMDAGDPFDLGGTRAADDTLTPVLLRTVSELLVTIERPTRLSKLLSDAVRHAGPSSALADRLPWALAVTIGCAYGRSGGEIDRVEMPDAFDDGRLIVVATGERLPEDAPVAGDDLDVLPRRLKETG